MAGVASHALLALSVVALGAAALRIAALVSQDPLERIVAAAPLAAAAAIMQALLLGLVALGGDSLTLSAAAVGTWACVRVATPPPERPLLDEGLRALTLLPLPLRLAGGALLGVGGAWSAFLLRHPALGEDALTYHLVEVATWARDGSPGSVEPIFYGLPVGNYPLTNEVLSAWATGLSSSFVPATLLSPALVALLAGAGWLGLRRLGAQPLLAALSLATLCTCPVVVLQIAEAGNDLPALAWLACTAALTVCARERPALLGPAIVAAGLAVGTKTTTLPLAALVLALGFLVTRGRLRAVAPALGAAAAAALVVGGAWYARNLVTHGSPLWPFLEAPWGDASPDLVERVSPSLLERPRATLEGRIDQYVLLLGGALALLAGALLSPLASRRRVVLAAALVTALSVLIWAAAPVTGLADIPELAGLSLSTTRYLLPAVAAAAVTLVVAATTGAAGRALAIGALGTALAWNLVRLTELGFPVRPGLGTLVSGAVLGALVAAGAAPRLLRGLPRRFARTALAPAFAVVAALAAGAALSASAGGYVERHATATKHYDRALARWFAAQPRFRSGREPVAMAPFTSAMLAGDRLRHAVELIPAGEGCGALAARRRRGWVVLGELPRTDFLPRPRALDCVRGERPNAVLGVWRVFAPPEQGAPARAPLREG